MKLLKETKEDDYRIADKALDRFRSSKRFSNPDDYRQKYKNISDDEYKELKKKSLPDSASDEERAAYYNYIDNSSNVLEAVLRIVDKLGLEVEGLDARIKEGDSYLRKAKRRNSATIEDCVRFSIICTNQNLVKAYYAVDNELKSAGYKVHMVENNFTDDSIALNNLAVYYEKNGALFEIWFHTNETITALHKAHKYYEVVRSYDRDDPEELAAILRVLDDMFRTSKPDGIESIKSTGTYLHEDFEEDEMPYDIDATLDVIKRAWRAIH